MNRLATFAFKPWRLFVCAVLSCGPGYAQDLSLAQYPSNPRSTNECSAVHQLNSQAIQRFFRAEYAKADSFLLGNGCGRNSGIDCSIAASRVMNNADRVQLRALEEDNRMSSVCSESGRQYEALQREHERAVERQRQAAEAQARQSQAQAFVSANKAYEAAKQAYSDTKRVGNLMTNPRDEIGRMIGERIAEFGQQGAETALRGPAPSQNPEYNAAHDRIKELNDRATRDEGIRTIQDATLDELKRKNNQTLSEIDSLNRQIAEFNQSSAGPAKGQSSITTGTLRVPDQTASPPPSAANPWADANGIANGGGEGRHAAGGTTDLQSTTTTTAPRGSTASANMDNDANLWAESPSTKQSGRASQTVALANPFESPTTSNPWASAESSPRTVTTSYVDPGTHTEHKIPSGYTLFRDPRTGKLSVVKLTKARLSAGGDQPNSTACSRDGFGIVTPECEARRSGP